MRFGNIVKLISAFAHQRLIFTPAGTYTSTSAMIRSPGLVRMEVWPPGPVITSCPPDSRAIPARSTAARRRMLHLQERTRTRRFRCQSNRFFHVMSPKYLILFRDELRGCVNEHIRDVAVIGLFAPDRDRTGLADIFQ
jgi:hypothetical protein